MQENLAGCPRLPAAFTRAGRLMPLALLRQVAEPLLNRVFIEAINDGTLDLLQTREIALHVEDLELRLGFRIRSGRLCIGPATEPAAIISGPLAAYLWLATREADADTLFFHRHLSMSGDTELGLAIKNAVDAVDLERLPDAMIKGMRGLARLVPAQAPGGSATRMPGSPYQ